MRKIIFFLSGLMVINVSGFSQDIHFSQYNETPSLVNPALTGAEYVVRASVNYKDQWGSVTVPYRTYGASFDMKLKASSWDKTDKFKTKSYKKAFNRLAGGLSFFSDKAGDGAMSTNFANLSLATFIRTGALSTFSVGLQGGMVQKSVNFNKFIFSNQYNGSTYDTGPAQGEDYSSRNVIYPDVSAGALWRYEKEEGAIGDNDQLMGDVGVSVMHVNKPRQKLLAVSSEQLYSRFNVHGKMLIGIPHSSVAIAPSFLCQFQGSQKEILTGMMVKYYFKHDSKYTGFVRRSSGAIGLYYRNRDAVIFSMLLEMGPYAIGISYDLNTSGLGAVSKLRGGPEITLRFNSVNRFLFQKNG
jgi:type IX secretion system PorP/SprF family membrane protein